MKVSVVIPTYNRCDVLAGTLPTVLAQDFPSDEYEVVVVVDGSSDGTVGLLRGLRPRCSLLVIEQANRGQGAARNAGLNASRGSLVIFLDDDLRCGPTLVGEHVAAHEGEGRLLVVGPVLLAPESPDTLSACISGKASERWADRIARQPDGLWPIDLPIGTNISVSRSAVLACGGFDEGFSRMHEDLDLALRLRTMGVRLRYQPTAVTYQFYVKSAEDLVRRDAYWQGRNSISLCRKHPAYRPYACSATLTEGHAPKRILRQLAVRTPLSPEPLLRVAFQIAQRFQSVPELRRIGARILSARIVIAALRSAQSELGSWQALRREFGLRLPVLLYHHVGPRRPATYPELTVSPEQFERQVRWLARHGYVGIQPSEWLKWCREGKALPDSPVLITLDDSYADTAEYALPILRRYRFSAAVYVVTGRIGGTNAWDEAQGSGTHRLMNAEQIRYWAADGIEFGAHSRTHADLTALSGEQLREEIEGSREDLSTILGTRPVSFAYPYGAYDQRVRECVARSFDLALSCEEGLNSLPTDPYLLRRAQVLPSDGPLDFACRVRLGWLPIQRLHRGLRLRTRAAAPVRWLRALVGS